MSRSRANRDFQVELTGISLLFSEASTMSGLAFTRDLSSGEILGVLPLDEERYAVFFRNYEKEYVYTGTSVTSFSKGVNQVMLVSSLSGRSRLVELPEVKSGEEWVSLDVEGRTAFLLYKVESEYYLRVVRSNIDSVQVLSEEKLPEGTTESGEVVVFNKGVVCDGSSVYLFGSSGSKTYVARASRLELGTGSCLWSFLSGRSYSASPNNLRSLETPQGPLDPGQTLQGLVFRGSLYLIRTQGSTVESFKQNRSGIWERTASLYLGSGVTYASVETGLPTDNSAGRTPTLPLLYNKKRSDGTTSNHWTKLTI